MKRLKRLALLLTVLLLLPLLASACSQVNFGRDWRSASRASKSMSRMINVPLVIKLTGCACLSNSSSSWRVILVDFSAGW